MASSFTNQNVELGVSYCLATRSQHKVLCRSTKWRVVGGERKQSYKPGGTDCMDIKGHLMVQAVSVFIVTYVCVFCSSPKDP